jgi:hypothetical protein
MYSETMNAFFATNRLSAYIDGELPEAEMAEVEKAIRDNPSVRAEYSRMMNAVELLRSQGPSQAPDGFAERLEARLALEKMPRAKMGWLPAPLRRIPMEALGLAMAALLVVTLIQRDPTPQVLDADKEEMLAKEKKPAPPPAPPEEDRDAEAALGVGTASQVEKPKMSKEQVARRKDELPQRTVTISKKGRQANPAKQEAVPESTVDYAEEPMMEGGVFNWEEEYEEALGVNTAQSNTGPTVTIGPVRYRLYPKSAEVLWQIAKLAKRFGARLTTSNGRTASPFSMTTEKNYANLKLQMSPARLEAFVAALHDLGAMTLVQQDETRLYSGGMMELELEIQFEP